MIYVDPGVHACGVAYFSDKLHWARYIRVEDLSEQIMGGQPLVIEMPRIYPGSGQQKGDLNDLLDLAAIVGYCEGLNGLRFPPPRRVFPAQWKGQVPKKIMTARILKHLTPYELDKIERVGAKDHNTIDAIGIGLWDLGRL